MVVCVPSLKSTLREYGAIGEGGVRCDVSLGEGALGAWLCYVMRSFEGLSLESGALVVDRKLFPVGCDFG